MTTRFPWMQERQLQRRCCGQAGSYVGVVFQQGHTIDFLPVTIAAGEDKTFDFDMTRKEYLDKMSPADKEALEEYKKKNAEVVAAANAKIGNLNNLLKTGTHGHGVGRLRLGHQGYDGCDYGQAG